MGVMDIFGDGWKVMFGSCLDRLPELADESVDAVVCDPPYELGFMGKSWDSSGIAYDVNVWKECLRVLKPGGHVLAFGGSRTWHRLAVAVEDAGFELRDSIAWLYGSGFPKSLDVSKAIDKGTGENRARQLKFTAWMRSSGVTTMEARNALFDAGLITEASNQASHYFAATIGSQPGIATADMFDAMRHLLPEVPEEIERLVAERTGIEWTAYKNREVIGKKTSGIANKDEKNRHTIGASQSVVVDITAPSTPEAQKWQGWGTALKPAFEPVVVGRKPLIGTVAENVLAYGVGGLNIDATRIGTEERVNPAGGIAPGANNYVNGERWKGGSDTTVQGRWPSNVILDEYTAALVDEQSGFSKSSGVINRWTDGARPFGNGAGGAYESVHGVADSGGASRFFYIAKANKRDRNEGLDGLEAKEPTQTYGDGMNTATKIRTKLQATNGVSRETVKNFHPTVKPTELMRQLIRLVTPPGGIVLDPFTGSGSTGKAAILEGMQFVGCELTEDYLPIIQGRIDWAVDQVKAEADKDGEKLF